jgi:DNA repair protein RadC
MTTNAPSRSAGSVTRTTSNSTTSRTIARLAQLELRILLEDEELPGDADDNPAWLRKWGLANQPNECLWVICFDQVLHLRTIVEINRGDHQGVDVHLPTLLAAVLTCGTERFMIAHNHPSGDPRPTVKDYELTSRVTEAANMLNLYLDDHYILSPRGSHSMTDAGWLKPAPYAKPGSNILSEVHRG